jgi:hypothetical protein
MSGRLDSKNGFAYEAFRSRAWIEVAGRNVQVKGGAGICGIVGRDGGFTRQVADRGSAGYRGPTSLSPRSRPLGTVRECVGPAGEREAPAKEADEEAERPGLR